MFVDILFHLSAFCTYYLRSFSHVVDALLLLKASFAKGVRAVVATRRVPASASLHIILEAAAF